MNIAGVGTNARRQAVRKLFSRLISIGSLVLVSSSCESIRNQSYANLLTVAAPASVEQFQLKTSNGELIWEIGAPAPLEVSLLRFGVVPPGFRQIYPGGGMPPRDLSEGEALVTVTTTESRVFVHEGRAVGTSGFAGGVWEPRPRAEVSPG